MLRLPKLAGKLGIFVPHIQMLQAGQAAKAVWQACYFGTAADVQLLQAAQCVDIDRQALHRTSAQIQLL